MNAEIAGSIGTTKERTRRTKLAISDKVARLRSKMTRAEKNIDKWSKEIDALLAQARDRAKALMAEADKAGA